MRRAMGTIAVAAVAAAAVAAVVVAARPQRESVLPQPRPSAGQPYRSSRWIRRGRRFPNNWIFGWSPASPSMRRITSGCCSARHAERLRRKPEPRRRCWSSTPPATSSRGGVVRRRAMSGPTSEHGIYVDPEGLRLDRRQRRQRPSDPQVHEGRKIRHADRTRRAEQGQRGHAEPEPAGGHVRVPQNQRAVRRRRVRQPARHRLRCGHRRVQADVGRVRQRADRHAAAEPRGPRRGRGWPAAVRSPGARGARLERRPRLCLRSWRQAGAGLHARRASTSSRSSSAGNARRRSAATARLLQARRFPPIPSSGSCTSATGARRGSWSSTARHWTFSIRSDRSGSAPGEFGTLHHMAVDSKGNLYVTEVTPLSPENSRIQKFALVPSPQTN